MPRILLEVKEHLHEVIHSWVALLKINHDCRHTHNKNQLKKLWEYNQHQPDFSPFSNGNLYLERASE